MFQRKICKKFKELPKVFGIADNILIERYNGNDTGHDRTLYRVLQICRNENLKFNKDKLQVFLGVMNSLNNSNS